MKRECGMLLPVASLPSRYGIGAFSKEAYEFVDMLQETGQSYWQILPLGPTGYGDSPYQSFSAFAGNPYFIDLEQLIEQGLLTDAECTAVDFGSEVQGIDYQKMYDNRFGLLRQAFLRWKEKHLELGRDEMMQMLKENLHSETLEYCFYMAVKNAHAGASWDLWEEEIRLRKPEALEQWKERLQDDIEFYEFQQYLFQQQWQKLKTYANQRGIRIIGDIPIYVSFDGADSWAHPELFQFDEAGKPIAVAGCPPDGFSATGQLWGNPLYRWGYHKENDYTWWMERMRYSFALYDVVRIDHFRGFDEYYSIPYGNATAEFGHWESGPGIEIFTKMRAAFPALDVIAEDLGFLTPAVLQLVEESGFPGMKVLEFAFDADGKSVYLPHRYPANCVVYTGTHDNNTLQGWYQELSLKDREFVADYLGTQWTPNEEIHWAFIRAALASPARLAIIPVQDYLGLGVEARVNEPSTLGRNWQWRMRRDAFDEALRWKCRRLADLYDRTR